MALTITKCDFDNDALTCPRCGATAKSRGARRICRAAKPTAGPEVGPGTELKKLLARLGIVAKPGCKCHWRAAEMDQQGPDWCAANISTITGWLREEYNARRKVHAKKAAAHEADTSKPKPKPLSIWLRLPFSEIAARKLIETAIRRAR
jgi:hypothetical protein